MIQEVCFPASGAKIGIYREDHENTDYEAVRYVTGTSGEGEKLISDLGLGLVNHEEIVFLECRDSDGRLTYLYFLLDEVHTWRDFCGLPIDIEVLSDSGSLLLPQVDTEIVVTLNTGVSVNLKVTAYSFGDTPIARDVSTQRADYSYIVVMTLEESPEEALGSLGCKRYLWAEMGDICFNHFDQGSVTISNARKPSVN